MVLGANRTGILFNPALLDFSKKIGAARKGNQMTLQRLVSEVSLGPGRNSLLLAHCRPCHPCHRLRCFASKDSVRPEEIYPRPDLILKGFYTVAAIGVASWIITQPAGAWGLRWRPRRHHRRLDEWYREPDLGRYSQVHALQMQLCQPSVFSGWVVSVPWCVKQKSHRRKRSRQGEGRKLVLGPTHRRQR